MPQISLDTIIPVSCRIKQIYDVIAEADKDGHPVLSNIYLTTTSTAMATDRPWEKEYCTDDHYRAPSDEERAKLQVFNSWADALMAQCCMLYGSMIIVVSCHCKMHFYLSRLDTAL